MSTTSHRPLLYPGQHQSNHRELSNQHWQISCELCKEKNIHIQQNEQQLPLRQPQVS